MLYFSSLGKCTKDSTRKRTLAKKIFGSDFGSKWVKNCQILVMFSGKIGQIVIQIFGNFSQVLIVSKLV